MKHDMGSTFPLIINVIFPRYFLFSLVFRLDFSSSQPGLGLQEAYGVMELGQFM
jgi:hypothetical protein